MAVHRIRIAKTAVRFCLSPLINEIIKIMFISIEIGGTNTRIGSSKNLKDIKEYRIFSTQKDFNLGIKKIIKIIEEMALQSQIKGLAIGLPGIVDKKKHKLIKSPHLKKWINKPIFDILSKKFKCPIFIQNDTALAGLGEAVFGAGKKYEIIAYLAIGTGVGGVRIVNKQIDQSAQGFEPGHQIVKLGGNYLISCGQKGCLESYVSKKSFYQRYKIKPENCNNIKIWQEFAKNLSQGVINTIVFWSPHIVIIGGGFCKREKMLFDPLRLFVKQNLLVLKPPLIVKSRLEDKAGVYGGFSYLKTHLK